MRSIIIAMLIAGSLTATAEVVKSVTVKGRYYELVPFKGTWEEAQADAKAKGGKLCSTPDPDVRQAVYEKLLNSSDFVYIYTADCYNNAKIICAPDINAARKKAMEQQLGPNQAGSDSEKLLSRPPADGLKMAYLFEKRSAIAKDMDVAGREEAAKHLQRLHSKKLSDGKVTTAEKRKKLAQSRAKAAEVAAGVYGVTWCSTKPYNTWGQDGYTPAKP